MCTSIPSELFGDAVMVLEFLNAFGPLFNMGEVIRSDVTFGKPSLLIKEGGGGGGGDVI